MKKFCARRADFQQPFNTPRAFSTQRHRENRETETTEGTERRKRVGSVFSAVLLFAVLPFALFLFCSLCLCVENDLKTGIGLFRTVPLFPNPLNPLIRVIPLLFLLSSVLFLCFSFSSRVFVPARRGSSCLSRQTSPVFPGVLSLYPRQRKRSYTQDSGGRS